MIDAYEHPPLLAPKVAIYHVEAHGHGHLDTVLFQADCGCWTLQCQHCGFLGYGTCAAELEMTDGDGDFFTHLDLFDWAGVVA